MMDGKAARPKATTFSTSTIDCDRNAVPARAHLFWARLTKFDGLTHDDHVEALRFLSTKKDEEWKIFCVDFYTNENKQQGGSR